MKMFVALVSGVLLSSAAIAQHDHGASTGNGNEAATEANERANEAPAPQAEVQESGERRICRRIDRSESRLARQRICMTAEQWRAHNRDN